MENIYLRPMTEGEYARWHAHSFANYAKEKEKSGLSAEDAKLVAEQSFKKLLPNGRESPGQFLYSVVERGSETLIGFLWWGLQGEGQAKSPWIYDIELQPEHRGKGYGRATMLAAENTVKKQGYTKLGLHVFGHNTVARKLYESLDFRVTNVVMSKELA